MTRTRSLAFVLFVLTSTTDASADYLYNVDGMLAISGNCPGACVEALAFSFVFQWQPIPPEQQHSGGLFGGFTYRGHVLPETSRVVSLGPLLPFHFGETQSYYLSFFNDAGDEIDIIAGMSAFGTATPDTEPPRFLQALLWDCQSQACDAAFGMGPRHPIELNGLLTTTVTRIPEPESLLLLGIGIATLVGVRRLRLA